LRRIVNFADSYLPAALATLKIQYSGKATSGQFQSSIVFVKNADRLATGLQPDYPGHFAVGAAIGLP